MTGDSKKRKSRASKPQARGVKRRERLLSSALSLLGREPFNDITYQKIADEAGVPLASCYNFYRSKLELVRRLADDLTDEYLREVFAERLYARVASWHDCLEIHVTNTVAHHNRSPAELQIFFSGDVPLKIRQDALARERIIGRKLLELVRRRFDIPATADDEGIFFRAVEIGRTVLALDFQERDRLDGGSVIEAVRAMTGYLANYLPPVLPPRIDRAVDRANR